MSDSDRVREVFAEFRRGVREKVSLDDVATRRALAEAYADTGLRDEAIEELETVLAAAPGDEGAAALLRRLRKEAATPEG